jgi:hypothetical protein
MDIQARQATPIEFEALRRSYMFAAQKMFEDYQVVKDLEQTKYNGYRFDDLKQSILWFISTGVSLSQAILGMKEIPQGKAKKLELAVRVFMSATTRGPNKLVEWIYRNIDAISFLKEAANWPDKKEDESDDRFTVGPFTVHNVMGLAGKDLEVIKDALARAVVLIKALNVPGIDQVLYGDVMIVGKLKGGTVAAWYYIQEDVVYVRPFKHGGMDEIHSIIHELGHRYIHKFIDKASWYEWQKYHDSVRWKKVDVNLKDLAVGDEMPFKVKGLKGVPVIQRIEQSAFNPTSGARYIYFSDTKVYPERTVHGLIKNEEEQKQRYPTLYAATSDAEHFCEALAHRAMGKLKEPNLSAFKSIIDEGKPGWEAAKLASKVANRYLQSKGWFGMPDAPFVQQIRDIKDKVDPWIGLAIIPGNPNPNMDSNHLARHTIDDLPSHYGMFSDYIITKPTSDIRAAYREAQKAVKEYLDKSPLNEADTVVMAYWKDADKWAGVINYRELN